MKVALVHDWITGMRGGEKCLEAFIDIYPDADVFTLIHVPGSSSEKIDARVKQASFLNRLPGVAKYYRALLAFFPIAIRSLKIENYDLVISLSHAAAKNIKHRGGIHVCYCFTPMRYIWDQAKYYLGKARWLFLPLIYLLRIWDQAGAKRVNYFVAISNFVAARIRCYYHRESKVIYPPVKTNLSLSRNKLDFFLYLGALVPYKRVDLLVQAFNDLQLPLIIAGKGSELKKLKQAAHDNIRFQERVSDEELWKLYSECRALLFPGTEDFGIVPIEAMSAGVPVIASYTGGTKETVRGIRNSEEQIALPAGVFIQDSSDEVSEIKKAVQLFISKEDLFTEEACRKQAELFSEAVFYSGWFRFCQEIDINPGLSATLSQELKKANNA